MPYPQVIIDYKFWIEGSEVISEVQSVVVVMSSSSTGLEAALLGACERELRLVLFSPGEAQVPTLCLHSFILANLVGWLS